MVLFSFDFNHWLEEKVGMDANSLSPLRLQRAQQPNNTEPVDDIEKQENIFHQNHDAAKIANYYAAKYRRNADYLLEIVENTFTAAENYKLSPFILLAIISHESNFLRTAKNPSGAEGLMQVMTPVHKKRFEEYGGVQTTYIPEVNIRVGATILRDCIDIMKSVRGGLQCYAGTVNGDDGGFVDYVITEATMIKKMSKKTSTDSNNKG